MQENMLHFRCKSTYENVTLIYVCDMEKLNIKAEYGCFMWGWMYFDFAIIEISFYNQDFLCYAACCYASLKKVQKILDHLLQISNESAIILLIDGW